MKESAQVNKNLLLVEDDPDMRRLIETYLVSAGFEVETACDGLEAYNKLLKKKYPIVLTDWNMPEMDGLELCKRIRTQKGIGFTYILMLTANDGKAHVVQALEAGADDYIRKQTDPGELIARVKAAMRIVKLEADLANQNREILKANADMAILNQRLEVMATTDELTELPNRRQAMMRLTEWWKMFERHTFDLTCIMIDVDHFKSINDNYGHDMGDHVLKAIASNIAKQIRIHDTVARIGGEEFLVICPHTSLEQASIPAMRIREQIQLLEINHADIHTHITVSVGVAAKRADMAEMDDLLKAADQALYEAKQTGRNRVVANLHDETGIHFEELASEDSCATSIE